MATEKRLIDANALFKAIKSFRWFGDTPPNTLGLMFDYLKMIIRDQPTVDAVEVVHGHWRYYSTTMQECSNCQRHTARHKFKYCPHCGAVMEDKYNDG